MILFLNDDHNDGRKVKNLNPYLEYLKLADLFLHKCPIVMEIWYFGVKKSFCQKHDFARPITEKPQKWVLKLVDISMNKAK